MDILWILLLGFAFGVWAYHGFLRRKEEAARERKKEEERRD